MSGGSAISTISDLVFCDMEREFAATRRVLERVPDEHARVLAHARRLYLTATYAEETWPAAVRAAAPGCAAHLTDRIRAAGAAVGSG